MQVPGYYDGLYNNPQLNQQQMQKSTSIAQSPSNRSSYQQYQEEQQNMMDFQGNQQPPQVNQMRQSNQQKLSNNFMMSQQQFSSQIPQQQTHNIQPLMLDKDEIYKTKNQAKPQALYQEYREVEGIQYKVIVLDYQETNKLKVCFFNKPYNIFLIKQISYEQVGYSKKKAYQIAKQLVSNAYLEEEQIKISGLEDFQQQNQQQPQQIQQAIQIQQEIEQPKQVQKAPRPQSAAARLTTVSTTYQGNKYSATINKSRPRTAQPKKIQQQYNAIPGNSVYLQDNDNEFQYL